MSQIKSNFVYYIFFFIFLSIFYPEVLSNFKTSIPFLLGAVMFFMGLTLELQDIKKVLKKPIWIFTTVFLQFTIMPTVAYFLVKISGVPTQLALGIIILGCCPGGTASNLITYLCKGNVALSIISTFCSTIISVIITPILIFLLSKQNINIDIILLMKSAFLIVFFPVVFGFLFKYLNPELKIDFLPKISEFFIALIIGIIFSLNLENIKDLSFILLLCILFHNIFGLVIGYIFAIFLNFPKRERRTISIEVGMQNSGLGMALSIIHFSKLVALPSAIFSLLHNISGLALVYFWKNK